ncbi:MarR family transcriptional regulator [Candidatus Formimonas warabiya]|uniref:MarR family transcriptional regulator n=1 Tax=Formimonas warabiya TaxID=1761012 RepID=A0A3G1KWX0_FORW1|nr:MarR family transcriptional regulator [Candidatus Formimonas warabiya]ATW26859.1 MarR family transcriptional regulator [Candidatus Formimonas warabiya]
MGTQDLVLKTLAESEAPLKPGEIAQIAGIDQKEVEKAIKALKNEGKITSPKRCYYSIV